MGFPIQAIARVRPPAGRAAHLKESCVQVATAASQIILGYDHFFDFDAVYDSEANQKELYVSCLADKVATFFEGYNVSVVSYGQRGAGMFDFDI